MQNSALFRMGFVAPLDDEALLALRAGDVALDIAVEFVPISQGGFGLLWRGFFSEVCRRVAPEIDEYEDTEIPVAVLGGLCGIAEQYAGDKSLSETARSFCRALWGVSARAQARGMPVFAIL